MNTIIKRFDTTYGGYDYIEYNVVAKKYHIGNSRAHTGHYVGDSIEIEVVTVGELKSVRQQLDDLGFKKVEKAMNVKDDLLQHEFDTIRNPNKKGKENAMVELQTYKYNNKGCGLGGQSKTVKIGRKWLLNEIAPMSLDEFLDSYTWDESDELYKKYVLTRRDGK